MSINLAVILNEGSKKYHKIQTLTTVKVLKIKYPWSNKTQNIVEDVNKSCAKFLQQKIQYLNL